MFTITIKLTNNETDETYTTFEQAVDCYFEAVIEKAEDLVNYVKKHYDTIETYEMTMYILNDEGVAIY
tara:strand:- start:267 stop:470 length:204 start_codon:yes stop_codon:yes gene_type:complete